MKLVVDVTHRKNRKEFEFKLNRAFNRTCEDYNDAVDRYFYQDITWDGNFKQTYRRSGQVVPAGAVRDTVDTGELVNSRDSSFPDFLKMEVRYNAPHAHDVFTGQASVVGISDMFGATRINLKKSVPPRPIPKIVAAEFDWAGVLKKHWDDVND